MVIMINQWNENGEEEEINSLIEYFTKFMMNLLLDDWRHDAVKYAEIFHQERIENWIPDFF